MLPKIHLEGLVQGCPQESNLALSTDTYGPALPRGGHVQAPRQEQHAVSLQPGPAGCWCLRGWGRSWLISCFLATWPWPAETLSAHLPSRPEFAPQDRPLGFLVFQACPWLCALPPQSTAAQCCAWHLWLIGGRSSFQLQDDFPSTSFQPILLKQRHFLPSPSNPELP